MFQTKPIRPPLITAYTFHRPLEGNEGVWPWISDGGGKHPTMRVRISVVSCVAVFPGILFVGCRTAVVDFVAKWVAVRMLLLMYA